MKTLIFKRGLSEEYLNSLMNENQKKYLKRSTVYKYPKQ